MARFEPDEFGNSVDDLERTKASAAWALDSLRWDQCFDFCERLYSRLAASVTDWDGNFEFVAKSREESQSYIAHELRLLFYEESLAYEFSNGSVQRRGRNHTEQQAARAHTVMTDPKLSSARRHYLKAQRFFRDTDAPDYENSIKEAVCAVEAAAKALFPAANAKTLGEFATWLRRSSEVNVPGSIVKTFEGTYGFRSSGDGIGHGGATGGAPTEMLAEFVLGVSASQVILLVDLADENDVPF